MTNNTVTFHFTDTETTVVRTSRHRLTGERGSRAECPIIDLVLHHMLQPHVVSRPHKNLHFDLFPGHAVI